MRLTVVGCSGSTSGPASPAWVAAETLGSAVTALVETRERQLAATLDSRTQRLRALFEEAQAGLRDLVEPVGVVERVVVELEKGESAVDGLRRALGD